jgi:citrate synthase
MQVRRIRTGGSKPIYHGQFRRQFRARKPVSRPRKEPVPGAPVKPIRFRAKPDNPDNKEAFMQEVAKLIIDGKEILLPVIEGSEGDKAIDIRSLRQKTGYITFDPGFGNTGTCRSAITYMDGEKGILRYRGIPFEQLAEHSTFVETAFLLIAGQLPTREELTRTSVHLNDFSPIHENMKAFYQNYPPKAHPMGILSAMVNAMRAFYPELMDHEEEMNKTYLRLISKIRTMSAMAYRISLGNGWCILVRIVLLPIF